jgi:hypothetical protein
LNRYSYADNSPLRYVDSDGHFPVVPVLLGIAVGYVIYDYLAHPDIVYAPDEEMAAQPLPPSDLEDNDRALCDWCVDAQKGNYGPAAAKVLLDAAPIDKVPGTDKVFKRAFAGVGIEAGDVNRIVQRSDPDLSTHPLSGLGPDGRPLFKVTGSR